MDICHTFVFRGLFSILVFFYHCCHVDPVVGDYLQGLKLQSKFGSLEGAVSLWFNLHTEGIHISRSWDVVVQRNLGKEVHKEGLIIINVDKCGVSNMFICPGNQAIYYCYLQVFTTALSIVFHFMLMTFLYLYSNLHQHLDLLKGNSCVFKYVP